MIHCRSCGHMTHRMVGDCVVCRDQQYRCTFDACECESVLRHQTPGEREKGRIFEVALRKMGGENGR